MKIAHGLDLRTGAGRYRLACRIVTVLALGVAIAASAWSALSPAIH